MTLSFPNQSRSFEPRQNRVRFWGYDSAIEITFFIGEDAFEAIDPDADFDRTNLLNVFDSAIERIHQVACQVYNRRRDRSYVYILGASDF